MSLMITCPDCDKTLKVKDEAAGKKVRCPACSNVFTARSKPKKSEDDFLDDVEQSAPPKRKRRVIEDDQDDEEQLPVKKPRSVKSASTKQKSKKSDSKALLIGLGVLGGFLFLVAGGAFVYGFMNGLQKARLKQSQQVQQANWTTFKHPSGLGQVDMPGVPTFDAKLSADGGQTYSLKAGNRQLTFSTLVLPGDANGTLAENPVALDIFCKTIVETTPKQIPGAQVISDRRFTSGTIQGLEIKLSVLGNINTSRYYILKEAIIGAEFVTRNESADAADRDRYFKSIRGPDGNLIEDPSHPPVNTSAPSQPPISSQPTTAPQLSAPEAPATISHLDKPAPTTTDTTTSTTSNPNGSTTVTTTTKETRQNNQGGMETRTSTTTRTRRGGRTTGIRPGGPSAGNSSKGTLVDARSGFQTKLLREDRGGQPVPEPPAKLAQKVTYDAPSGKLSAYVTTIPSDGQKHPALVWISGGDCNSIDAGFFKKAPAKDDQTASAFREAGIVTMYPSLRGGNDNPGVKESFLGEVDDVLAAADFLSKLDGIDPDRIYLAGHSTGGTLALLVAAMPNDFRAIFSFGPVDDIRGYGDEFIPFDPKNQQEFDVRNPKNWMNDIQHPTFVMEGMGQPGNFMAVSKLMHGLRNKQVTVLMVPGANHFSILAPVTKLLAEKIVADTGPDTNISLQQKELHLKYAK